MARVLLDENIDRRLASLIDPAHEVVTVTEAGWSGMKNGDLLSVASRTFDVLLTMDRNLRHQQNVAAFNLAIVVVMARSNRREDVAPAMPKLNRALKDIRPGALIEVSAEPET